MADMIGEFAKGCCMLQEAIRYRLAFIEMKRLSFEFKGTLRRNGSGLWFFPYG
jgi:hypothetical protein